MGWKRIHEEAPSGDTTIEAWYEADKDALLFVRENQGQFLTIYQSVEDVAANNSDFLLAEVCYGWYTFLWERGGKRHDDFLDDLWDRAQEDAGDPFLCHNHPGECADTYHAIQVQLGNEECPGCDICREHGVPLERAV